MPRSRQLCFILVLGACKGAAEDSGSNTPPVGLEVRIEPLLAEQQLDDLRCKVYAPATDAQQDPIEYRFEWSVDGAEWTDVGSSGHYEGDVVAAEHTVAGQEWTCTGVPSDPYSDGAADSFTLTILSGFTGWEEEIVPADQADYILEGSPASPIGAGLALGPDVDGDGRAELLLPGSAASAPYDSYLLRSSVWVHTAGSHAADADLVMRSPTAIGSLPGSAAALGDIDADGHADLALASPEAEAVYLISTESLPTGAAIIPLEEGQRIESPGEEAVALASGLLDGDGWEDLILATRAAEQSWLYMGSGGSLPATVEELSGALSTAGPIEQLAVADFDGDGLEDVAAGDPGVGGALVSLGDHSEWSCQLSTDSTTAGSRIAAAADLDGDALAELLVGDPAGVGETGAGDGLVWIVYGRSLAECSAELDLEAADQLIEGYDAIAAASALAAGDVDADYTSDLLVASPGIAEAHLLLGADLLGATVQLDSRPDYRFALDTAPASALLGDVDADGREDVLLGLPDEGEGGAVRVFRSP